MPTRPFKMIHHCPQCERGYEIEVPGGVRNLPGEFECPGCKRRYEVRLAFVDVTNRHRKGAQSGE